MNFKQVFRMNALKKAGNYEDVKRASKADLTACTKMLKNSEINSKYLCRFRLFDAEVFGLVSVSISLS